MLLKAPELRLKLRANQGLGFRVKVRVGGLGFRVRVGEPSKQVKIGIAAVSIWLLRLQVYLLIPLDSETK